MLVFRMEYFCRERVFERERKRIEQQCKEDFVLLPISVRLEQGKTLFLCDRRACDTCRPECRHTADIRHAVNFKNKFGVYIETEAAND